MTKITQQFIQVETKSNFETRLKAGDIEDTSIAFIEDSDQIWAKGKYYSAIPKEGHEKQILAWKAKGEAKWEDLATMFTGLEEVLGYGVQFDMTVADPHLTRIGNMSLHKSLPIQSQLKGCIAQEDKVIYWLDESDWRFKKDAITKSVGVTDITRSVHTIVDDVFSTLQYDKQWIKLDGTPLQVISIDTSTSTATVRDEGDEDDSPGDSSPYTAELELGAVLNGYDGTVRVYCPAFYIKSTVDGNIAKVWLSTVKIDDTYTYQPEVLIDAYRSTVLHNVPENMGYLSTLPVNSAISVVNTNTYCRGGIDREEYDQYLTTDPFRTDLGKPMTFISRTTMREYSRQANSQMLSYDQYKNIFYWLYVVEYANFNSQEDYNATLTDEGYHQGGMGLGITSISDRTWYNSFCPLTPCGYGNLLGNRTGLVSLTIPEFTYGTNNTVLGAQTMQMPRWRGFDNPFGDIWTVLDGIIIDDEGLSNNINYVYTCQDASMYADIPNDSYVRVGKVTSRNGRFGQYIKSFDLGDAAHIFPRVVGGDSTKYICDFCYTYTTEKGLYSLLIGGVDGGAAGIGAFDSSRPSDFKSRSSGFRTVSGFVSFPSDK